PDFAPVLETQGDVSRPIEIPAREQPIFCSLRLLPSPLGSVAALLFRVPAINLSFTDNFGRTTPIRVVPATLSNGFLANYLPLNQPEFEQLETGRMSHRMVSLKFSG